MKSLKNWWSGKSNAKRQNWMLLALAACFIASGFVESGSWIPVIVAVFPAGVLVYLEAKR